MRPIFSSTDSDVDLLDLLQFREAPPGVKRVPGFCPNREGSPDVAFQISGRTVATIPTARVFPDKFPADFSILATFKASPTSKSGWLLGRRRGLLRQDRAKDQPQLPGRRRLLRQEDQVRSESQRRTVKDLTQPFLLYLSFAFSLSHSLFISLSRFLCYSLFCFLSYSL